MDDEPMWVADHVVAPTPGSAITIPETANEFAIKALFNRLLKEIRAFSQHENESLTDAWLRMKEMLQNCHGHNLSKGNIIKKIYHGLSKITQEVLNAATRGIFLYKTPNQAYQLLEDKVLLKLDWAKNQKTKSSLKKTVTFADEELQSGAKQPTSDLDDNDMPMSREEEAKFMQTFREYPRKRDKKNQAKTDKIEHGMEKRGKDKVKLKPKSTKVKVNPGKVKTNLLIIRAKEKGRRVLDGNLEEGLRRVGFELMESEIKTWRRRTYYHETVIIDGRGSKMKKEMLRNCHGHNLSKGNIIKKNYHGLSEITQEVLNAAAGGIFLYKTPNQAYQLLEDKVLLKLDWAKNQKTKSSLKKTVAFADEGNSNSGTEKIMTRMDAMTIKMDAQYKELQS
ncbi:hypothetical protein Tco_1004631 [Tanacetum coccineum]|uniref:Retrotransposon gag domain-containing protein n=1 Tax=Tanacetum coccineum TaxID=301880 RepID=A0ABQ5FDW4_9ASTR